ncbi:hypothetical protein C4D60_Mb08t18610 [Musa balbisiana]|uniref:Uncharacterized protein n=1 Tax=Musa balbisiana TaxID=52838 RepID=A0A4S8K4Q6_MUSBA|nr:hypothetical protein C4D60_Mb08t18610 [Musa balbisiana]
MMHDDVRKSESSRMLERFRCARVLINQWLGFKGSVHVLSSHNNIRLVVNTSERAKEGGSVDFSAPSSFVDSRNGTPSSCSGRSRREIDQGLTTAGGILSGASSSR